MFVQATSKGSGPKPRQGFVLLAVLVVVVLLTLAASQYSEMMLAEYKASDAYTRSAQARALAESGIDYAAALLSSQDAMQNTLNGNPWSNPSAFQGVLVRDNENARLRGRFSLMAPLSPDQAGSGIISANQAYYFGVLDESSKINLQSLMNLDSSGQTAYNVLMKLPNMTDDVANSILDWIDSNTTMPRTNGAKDQYYTTLSPPYHCKNGPLDSIEELLLVKGVTPQLLFGNDRNRNGMLDPDENDGSGVVDRGWSAYLTIYTRELNVDSQGNPRIYINDSDLQTLYSNLQNAGISDDLASFIIAYRQYGPASSTSGGSGETGGMAAGAGGGGNQTRGGGANQPAAAPQASVTAVTTTASGVVSGAVTISPSGAGATARTTTAGQAGGAPGGGTQGGGANRLSRNQLNFQNTGNLRSISSLYSLVNAKVSIPSSDPNGQPTIYSSPMSDPSSIRQLFPTLYDKLTTQTAGELPGRVNVNTAPQAVLAALPGFSDSDVQAILNHRPDPNATQAPDAIFQTPAWLLTEANISENTLQTVDRYITARTQVYRVQAVGYFDGGGPTARIEAVIDTNAGRPRILYWRDLTELGKGYDLQN
jgi:type II secretory pathway component PulK